MVQKTSGDGSSEESTKDFVLNRWVTGESTQSIHEQTGLLEGTITTMVARARAAGDPRAVSRRRTNTLTVSLADDRRGSLLTLATTCLEESGAVIKADLATLRRAAGGPDTSRGHTQAELDALGPDQATVVAVQRAAHLAGRTPRGDELPFLLELSEELGVSRQTSTRLPASWWEDLASEPCSTTTAAYALGESFFTLVESVDSHQTLDRQLARGRDKAHRTIETLYSVAVQSPRVGARAVHLLGRLGILALDPSGKTSNFIWGVMSESPLGYRAMRVASRLLFAPSTDPSERNVLHENVEHRVLDLLRDVHHHQPRELYPDRSFVIETLFKMPTGGRTDRRDQLTRWLKERALGTHEAADGLPRPFRERTYAALVLASRFRHDEQAVSQVLQDFATRSYDEHGEAYKSATIQVEAAASRREILSNSGDRDPDEAFMQDFDPSDLDKDVRTRIGASISKWVFDAAGSGPVSWESSTGHTFNVPPRAGAAVSKLIECALGDLHGTRRRRAMDTLRHGGLGVFLALAGMDIAKDTTAPGYLRAQAAFAVSFAHHSAVVPDLVELARVELTAKHPDLHLASVALHAVGDLGLQQTEANDALAVLAGEMTDLLTASGRFSPDMVPVLRATGYALATVRLPDRVQHRSVTRSLQALSDIGRADDTLTHGIAEWGLARHVRQSQAPTTRIPDLFGRTLLV